MKLKSNKWTTRLGWFWCQLSHHIAAKMTKGWRGFINSQSRRNPFQSFPVKPELSPECSVSSDEGKTTLISERASGWVEGKGQLLKSAWITDSDGRRGKALSTPVKVRTFTGYCPRSLPFSVVNFALTLFSMDCPHWEARGRERSENEENITGRDSKQSAWISVCGFKMHFGCKSTQNDMKFSH